ncbi:MAG: hypothetical protein IPJ81_03870 [Chitinophagaceae bacterium]|nr:hypothetical protein [Chitinophagaceae bacterium]
MRLEDLQRVAYITHIHEAAAKSSEINSMLIEFYEEVCRMAKMKGIELSILFPLHDNIRVIVEDKKLIKQQFS